VGPSPHPPRPGSAGTGRGANDQHGARGNAQSLSSPLGKILSSELAPKDFPLQSAASLYTRPRRDPPRDDMTVREFWTGAKRLPPLDATPSGPRDVGPWRRGPAPSGGAGDKIGSSDDLTPLTSLCPASDRPPTNV